MIVVELQGGLGNQMFQYACGLALSLKHNQQLLIDTSFLKKNHIKTSGFTPRNFELDIFELNTAVADETLIKSFNTNTLANKLKKTLRLNYPKTLSETPGEGERQLSGITFPLLLKGYWQSEKFFVACENEIRTVFKFKTAVSRDTRHTLTRIKKANAVSIHVRRGDYITNAVAQKVLGALDIGYYHRAIERIKKEVDDPFFFIFSDDPEWVKENLKITNNCLVIEGFNEQQAYYDMLLMSSCRHHIIANSSFSWWGAWLNADPRKIVIAPERWFADDQMNANAIDLIPEGWVRI